MQGAAFLIEPVLASGIRALEMNACDPCRCCPHCGFMYCNPYLRMDELSFMQDKKVQCIFVKPVVPPHWVSISSVVDPFND